MNPIKLSLSIAKQVRLCPPPRIEANPLFEKEVHHHRSLCPYCSEHGKKGAGAWDALAGKIEVLFSPRGRPGLPNKALPGNEKGMPGPARGSICLVRRDLGKWREGYYYNPPAVMLIEETGAVSDDVLVAQIYWDVALAGPGDLIVPSSRSPLGEIFVEPWNIYTLRLRDLNSSLAKVDQIVVKALKALEADPDAYPNWAPQPRPMEEDDPRVYFREMEVEVGYNFSSTAVSGLLSELEGRSLGLVYRTPSEAIADIRTKIPGIQWPFRPVNIEEIIAAAQFPAEQYAMAAAISDRQVFKANLVTTRAGRVESIEPVEGEILQSREKEEGLSIGGHVFLSEGPEISGFICFLRTDESRFIPPETLKWDEKGSFLATFQVFGPIQAKLCAAAIREVRDG